MSTTDEDAGLPRFVEPDYNLDQTTPTLKEQEPEPCCSRCTSEWRTPGFFSIQEGDKTLDIPGSFGRHLPEYRVLKFCLMIWFLASLIYKWYWVYGKEGNAAFFLAFLTHWAMILATLWLFVSWINSLFPPSQPKRPSDSVSLWIKCCWILFTVAAHFTMITCILYWTLDYKPGKPLGYMNIFEHVLVLMIWPEGLILNRIPIRWKHLPFPMLAASLYIIWMVIHQLATDMKVPSRSDNDPDTNDDLLYPAVDFEDKTAFSSILCALVVFVATPLIHWLLWSLSLFSFPCNCSGYNRRYISESASSDSSSGKFKSSTNNVNVYEP